MKIMVNCKFKIGDKVTMKKKTLYDETEGVVYETSRFYQAIDSNGNFEPQGLCLDEAHLSSIRLPYRVIEDVLEVDHPETDYGTFILKAITRRSKLKGWLVSVKTPKMNTVYNQSSLKLKK